MLSGHGDQNQSKASKQYISKFINKFKNPPYIGNKSKQVQNKPTEAYLFLIKQIINLIKSEGHVRLNTSFVKSGLNEKIGHVNKTIGHVN